MVLFRPPPHPWRYLVGSTVIAAVIAAVVAAAFVWGPWGRQAYTFAQVEHAVEVIGAPPGFTQEVIRGMSDELTSGLVEIAAEDPAKLGTRTA